MIVDVKTQIEITPELMAEVFIDMGGKKQAEFFNLVGKAIREKGSVNEAIQIERIAINCIKKPYSLLLIRKLNNYLYGDDTYTI